MRLDTVVNILQQIMIERREQVSEDRLRIPYADLIDMAARRTHHSLTEKLRGSPSPCLIAEVKKASPSAGILREDYRPAEIAALYEQAGASAISVLTEPRHFLGSEQHLRDVRAAVRLPVLRKDFMCDPYQVAESAAWGADIILLIAAALAPEQVIEMYRLARELGLEVLIETHSEDELVVACECTEALIGVNSRNLKTLTTDLDVALSMADVIPEDRFCIAESGIRTREDILTLSRRGYRGFLVGESILRCEDPGAKVAELIGKAQP